MLILGVDPGLLNTGWGMIESKGSALRYRASGVIRPQKDLSLATRLAILHEQLADILKRWQPDTAAVEETFVNKDAKATLKLGHARGIALSVPALYGIDVAEYAANKVKKSVVGAGHADKNQVAMMVKMLLPACGQVKADEADALAVAICHAHYYRPAVILTPALSRREGSHGLKQKDPSLCSG